MIKSAYSLCINLLRMIGCTGTQLRLAVAMLFVLLATSMNVAHAQEAYATGFQSTLVYHGLNANAGVAVDVDGNVYVADYSDNEIIVETYQSQGVYTESCFVGTGTTLTGSACTGATSTLSKPYGVAVDANLNVYIADTDNGRVLLEKYVSPGVYTQSVIMASGNTYISSPTGIALDKNGNIYVTDPNTFNVIQLAAGTYTVTLVANSASTGLEDPNGVAVDSNLNIFIADVIEGVIEIPSTCTFPAPAVGTACGANTVSVIGSGISSPKGVGVDAQNSVYIASTGNSSLIKETIQASGGYGQTTLLTGLTSLDAVAVDASYNIYISLPSSEKVEELSPFDGNFGEVNIGSTSPVLTLTFDFLSGGEIGQILAVQKGATGSDFNLVTGSGAGTCAAGTTYDTGATCTVNVTFSPLYAGTRFGAVELMNADATPALFATAYIYGTGEGPQIIFLPGVDDYIYGNINNVAAVAVDGSDNIFVVSQGVAAVYEFTAASGYTDAIQFPGTSYGTLTDINTDGAGNVYISDSTNDVVYKFIAADAFQTVIAIDTGIAGPDGVAVDGFGNVFAASQSGGYVNEVLIESDYTIITQITTGSTGTSDIAVDGAGDLYVLNYSNGTVTEVLAVDGAIPASPTINTILTGLQTGCCTELESIKVDNVGNVYVADNNQATITEYYVAGGFSLANSMVVFPFPGASDMAIDGQGNIWASSGTVEYIGELSTGTAPSLYFDTTVGTPSAAQDVYIKNIGNETLTFPVEGSGNNPSISQYFTWSTSGTTTWNSVTYNDCPDATTSPQTLTVDTICGFPIIFDPTVSGAIDGSLVLTDNSGNYTGNTAQTVYLYGNATGPVLTVTATSFIIGTNGPAPTLEYTTDGSLGAASCTGTPTLTSNLPGATPYTETNPPIAGGITPYVVTITAGSFKCSGAGYPYSSVVFVNGTIEVGKNTAQLTLTTQNATMSYGQPIPTLTYTLTGFKGSDTQALDCTGAPTITTIATSSSPPGTYKITGDAGTLVCSSANYTYTITVLNSGVLTITMDTPTISWSPSPTTIAPGTALTAGELDAIADDGTTNVSADGTFVYYYHHGGTNTVVTAGYTALPNGTDELCAVWTPLSGYTADFNATAAPTANCVNITVTMNTIYTVTANNETITYGTTPPATYAGYTVSPTLPAACTGTVTYTLSPAAAYSPDPVGSYLIVPAGITCTGTNSISYVDGTLTVNQDTPILAYTGSTIVTGASLSSVPITVTNSNNSTVVTLGGTIAYKWNGISETSAYIPSAGSGSLCEVWTPSAAIDIVGTLSYASQYNSTVSTCETVTVSGTVALTLTTSNMSVTYGTTPNVTTDYTLTGFIGGDTQASACTGAPSLSTTATNTSLVSPPTYPVTATIGTLACSSSHATYTVTIVNTGVVTITKETVALTLTSANGTSVYGTTPNVSADYTLTGFVGSDTQASVCTGAPSVTTTATATSPVSPPTYPITAAAGTLSCTGDSNVTYTISIGSNSGKLTITKESVTLTLTTTNGTGAYGTTPAVTTDYTLTGFVGTDTQANACSGAPTVTTTATNTSAPGTYPISAVIGSLTCTRDADVTYTITIVSTGIYTVTQATANLTLTTTNGTGVFGSTPVVSSDYTLTGFHGSDTQANSCTGAPSITTTATNTSNVGTYTISGAIGTLVCDSTDYIYTVSTFTNNGKYTVTKYTGTLTLTTTNGTGTYGTTPVVTNDYTLTGFVGGQTQAGVCTHTPSITTTATNTSVPGNYPISGALGTPNFTCRNTNATYTITFVNTGIYTVTQASANLTLTSTNGTGAFGTTPNVASDYSLTGFQGSDTQANSCTGAPGVTTTATNTSNVGTYPITAAAGTLVCSSTDYTYTIVIGSNAGLYTVTKATATLTLTTGNISVVYGNTPNVAADYTLTGFIGGQTSAVCSGSPVITTTATNTSPVSPPTYPVTETGLGSLTCSNSNVTYNITNIVNTGVVTITQATANLTLTTTNVSSPFGSTPNVANAYTLTGFIDGQTSAVCSGSPVITTTATNTSPVSPPTYPITETGLGTLVCGNADVSYTITTIVNTGVVTITKASANLTLTTTNVSSVYGSTPNVANAYTLTGFIGGQTSAVCSGSPVITTTATNTSPVSPPTYPITETGLGTLTCSNADVTYTISTITNTGVVTITPTTAALTLTTGNISSPFGSTPNVAGDYTLTGFIGGQTSAVCSGSPIISTTATNTSPVSPPTYPVVATSLGTLTCSNADVTYTITIVNSGVVTVTQATGTLTLTSTSATSTYGTTPNVSADYTLTGFIGTDTQALACGATVPTVTTTATATSPISPPTYPITAAVGSLVCSDANATYSIVLGPNTGVLTIVDESGSGSQPNNFGSVPVNTTSSPLTVTFTFSNNGVIGSTKVLTTGITGLDFADVGTGTCDTNGPSYEYTSGSTCTMIVTFTPEYPGQRIGAVELLDGDGNLASTALLAGIGTGPDTTFAIYNGTTNLPATVTTVGSGFTKPTGLAVDAQGDVFVTDAAANTVSEVLAAGGYTTIKTLGSGFSGPAGVVIDGAGNLYVSDSNNNKVKEIVADGGYTTVKTLYTSASGPGGIAIDASGNLFITYPNSGTAPIVELTVASGYTTSIALDAGKFTDAGGIAIDNSGNLWVTDTGNNSLDEVTFASSYATVNVVNSSLTAPTGISLDSNANAYVDQGGATSVTYLAAPAYSVPSNYGSVTGGVYYGLALDGAGDIFAIDGTSNAVEKLNYSVAPTLIFASTPYDVTSPDSPQTVTLFNFGNAQLTLPIPATGNDASITTSFTLASGSAPECPLVTSSSANPGTLSASTSCTFPVSFTPLSVGSITGQLTLTDNNLNVSGSTQIINLNGTATAAAVTLTLTTTSISLPYGSVIPSVAGDYTLTGFVLGDSQGADCTGAPSLSTAATSTSPVGAYPITATIGSLVCSSANATYTVTIVNSGNVNITQATTDITWTPASIVYGNGLTAAQLDAQAFAGPSNVTNVSADGTFAYTYLGNPITTGTVLPYGSDTICVTFTPSAGYTADLTTASTCVALNVTQAPLTITATPYATAVYDTAVPNATFTYTIAGWVGTDTQNNVCTTPAPGGVTLSTPATDGSPVGIYTINVTPTMTCNGYYFVINTGELHITPAILTIVPVSTTVDYAQQVPTYSYNCYLNGTLEGTNNCGSYGITGGPTLTTTATIRATTTPGVVIYTSPIGTYTMNASLGSLKSTSANYTFGFGTATLIINPTTSDLTAKAGSYTINACAAVPTLTYTTSGYIDFDSAATQLTGTPNLQVLGLTSTCTAGTYTIQITAGSLAQTYGNYAGITYVNGTLTVR
jgi:hypothetical protein